MKLAASERDSKPMRVVSLVMVLLAYQVVCGNEGRLVELRVRISTGEERVFSGMLVSENANFVILDREGRRLSISKSIIMEVDGAPYAPPAAIGGLTAPGGLAPESPSETVEQPAESSETPRVQPNAVTLEGSASLSTGPAYSRNGEDVSGGRCWLNLVCDETSLKGEANGAYFVVQPKTGGQLIPALEGSNSVEYSTPDGSDFKGGSFRLLVDPTACTATVQDTQQCSVELQSSPGRRTLFAKVKPKPVKVQVTVRSRTTDYRLDCIDEDGGGTNDSLQRTPAERTMKLMTGHTYLLKFGKPGFRPGDLRMRLAYRDTTIDIVNLLKPRNRLLMSAMSLALPGWGQRYGDRPRAGRVYRGLAIVLTILTGLDAANTGFAKMTYDNLNADYVAESSADKRADIDRSRDNARRWFDISYGTFLGVSGALGLVWTINVADPLVFSIGRRTPVRP